MVGVNTDKSLRRGRTDELPARWLPIEAQPSPTNRYVDPINIITVLKPSETFTPEWVDKLYRMVARNITREFRFVCITNVPQSTFNEPVEVIPFKHGWASKHAKLEMFRPDLHLKGRSLYMDLDTVITGLLDDIIMYDGKFAALADYSSPLNKHYGTGFMLFEEGFGHSIYEAFLQTPDAVRNDMYRIGGGRGDQLFVFHYTPVDPHRVQRVWPGLTVSYREVRFRCNMTDNVRVVIFHGKDKPGEGTLPCIKAHWR